MKTPAVNARRSIAVLLAGFSVGWAVVGAQAAGSADLMQARNGTPLFPTDPVEWVKGNAGKANSHYVEGYSIAYRVVISGASAGSHTLVLEWDTRQAGKHAIDYLTHYNRLQPHNQFGAHTLAETINPISGLAGSFGAPATFVIPTPSSAGSPIAGQPSVNFDSLPAVERSITIWNGSITNATYVSQGSLDSDTAASRIRLDFVATAPTVVIAFGGHIASRLDWGAGNSAASIGGSPYHMRMISFDGGGGNQDRSVSALAVIAPPTCLVSGPDSVCAATTNSYTGTVEADSGIKYQWSLLDNKSGASIVGPANEVSVQVRSGSEGSYSLQVVATSEKGSSACTREITVNAATTSRPLSDETACLGSGVTFSTTAAGTGPFSYLWRRDTAVIAGATGDSLTLPDVTASDAGTYCVEVTGACGTVTQCATLTVLPAPALTCPPAVAVQCLGDIPPPAPASVEVRGGSGVITVRHAGDNAVTNGCEIVIARRYIGTDECGIEAVCEQTITVHDTIAPVISCGPNRTVECGAEWSFDFPSAIDNCDGPNTVITIVGTVTNAQCGNAFTATRTWQATDACGNSSPCSQTVTVVDTTAPVITCIAGRTVECGALWDFDAPTATDMCGDAGIVIAGTVTNRLSANLFSATRTWTAADACGNAASCSQTITVVDTAPPVITCPANITVPCAGSTGAGVSFVATATDVCAASPQVSCNPPSGSIFALGATSISCVAIDASSNRSECRFTVTVVDTVPPQIMCPASFVVLEEPAGQGSALVTYPAPTATDNCDASLQIACDPLSGSTLPVGEHVVTCTATDTSGNRTACTFAIQVVPRTIVASSTADSGPGTFRQALLDANAAPGTNVIQFAFPGNPPYTIHLLSPLPRLDDSVIIDGWSQLQFTGLPVIEIDGSSAVASLRPASTNSPGERVGLVATAGGSTMRGLTLNGFDIGISLEGPGGNVVQGNLIGTDPSGTSIVANTGDGIRVLSAGNQIGGASPSERNIISGNRGSGIRLQGGSATGNVIQGNLIGTAVNAIAPLGNLQHGVRISAGAAGNSVGGRNPGEGNVVAFNGGNGVRLDADAGTGNRIAGNAVFSNGGLGIDLGGDGTTPNDHGDIDEGPNRLQNTPVLSYSLSSGNGTSVGGVLSGAPNTTYFLEFFLNTVADESGSGAGQLSMSGTAVTTDGSGSQSFAVGFSVAASAFQFVTATATDPGNNTSEFAQPVPVGTSPVILVQPIGARTEVGASVSFCVTAIGSQPLRYQWRLNGANVPDATNRCLEIPGVQLQNGGSYTVVVANDLGIVVSEPAQLSLIFGDGVVGDNFADRVRLVNANGIKSGNNSAATFEAGEPLHRGKPGGKSIWYTWTAPALGIATFSTEGSAFDTLLAVYSGTGVSNLVSVARDEDTGGFYTSTASFNVTPGAVYQIAIDGFGGASGDAVVSWALEVTTDSLPAITNQPISKTVAPGSTATFTVGAFSACRDEKHDCSDSDKDDKHDPKKPRVRLSYQWFFNGAAIPGATNATLKVTNVGDATVGTYTVQVSNGARVIHSEAATLQINQTDDTVQNVQARDKFLDTVYSTPLRLGTPGAVAASAEDGGIEFQAASTVVRGYTGTQVFNTAGSSTEAGEEPICSVLGGASQWISFVAQETGTVFFNTDGSSYDTVIAAFTRMTNSSMLQYIDCDDNGGLDGRDSALAFSVQAGRTNFIVIDGVNGATGVLRLNYSLVTPTLLAPMRRSAAGDSRVRVSGRPNVRFTLQRSLDLKSWSSRITTNAPTGVFDYTDPGSAALRGKYYRALLLP